MVRTHAFIASLFMLGTPTYALAGTFGEGICNASQYYCLTVPAHETWESLFPDDEDELIVRKVNRMNTDVKKGMILAVPRDLETTDHMDFAPFPSDNPKGNVVKVDLSELAWGAYDYTGRLVNWGPISGGKSYCKDVRRACRTPTGRHTFYTKKGPSCVSSKFPVGKGGAPMPYCMFYKGGYALHGSPTVPGYNASHGCIRMFTDDAQWLNQNFVKTGSTRIEIVP